MDAPKNVAFFSLGSNLGDRMMLLKSAIRAVSEGSHARMDLSTDVASLYETMPVGGPAGQPRFLNTAIRLRPDSSPQRLLHLALAVEDSLGRVRKEHWGPRAIDIDLLLFGNRVIESNELTLPHPHMHQRRFVLEPLAEIAPDMVHPRLGLTIRQLAQEARAAGEADEVIRIAGPEWVFDERLDIDQLKAPPPRHGGT